MARKLKSVITTPVVPSRLDAKKANIQSNREASKVLKKLLKDITNTLDLDEERMAKRIDAATRSEYGAINGLVNLVASVANWPVENGDGALVSTNRLILEDKFNLDLVMLDDIRAYRGFHSFVTDDIEIINGQEPQYEDYTDYCEIFLEELGVRSTRPTICPDRWKTAETRAIAKAKTDQTQMLEELAFHKEYLAQLHGEA